jgi:hypothetical protein
VRRELPTTYERDLTRGEPTPPTRTGRLLEGVFTVRARFGWLLAELFIVFVGVYGAYLLQERQEEQAAERRRQQIYGALLDEIREISRNTHGVARQTKIALDQYSAAWKAKQFPAPSPMLETVAWTPHMWNATVTSGALQLLDVPTMYRTSKMYNDLGSAFRSFDQLRELSELHLIPVAGRDSTEYYDFTTMKVRPKYTWWFTGMRQLNRRAESVARQADSLIVVLSARAGVPVDSAVAARMATAGASAAAAAPAPAPPAKR